MSSALRVPQTLAVAEKYESGLVIYEQGLPGGPIAALVAVVKADEREGIDPRATAQLLAAAPEMRILLSHAFGVLMDVQEPSGKVRQLYLAIDQLLKRVGHV
jgi:hypothetical protein